MQTTTTSEAPSDQVVQRNVADTVIDPAADRAAAVDWVTRVVWFVIGMMSVLIAIRFVLLATGANENAGFSQLIYGLTGWMAAPFANLFGSNLAYPGCGEHRYHRVGITRGDCSLSAGGLAHHQDSSANVGYQSHPGTVYNETQRRTKV